MPVCPTFAEMVAEVEADDVEPDIVVVSGGQNDCAAFDDARPRVLDAIGTTLCAGAVHVAPASAARHPTAMIAVVTQSSRWSIHGVVSGSVPDRRAGPERSRGGRR